MQKMRNSVFGAVGISFTEYTHNCLASDNYSNYPDYNQVSHLEWMVLHTVVVFDTVKI